MYCLCYNSARLARTSLRNPFRQALRPAACRMAPQSCIARPLHGLIQNKARLANRTLGHRRYRGKHFVPSQAAIPAPDARAPAACVPLPRRRRMH